MIRKKETTIPNLVIVISVSALVVYFIYFFNGLGLSIFYQNQYLFTASIREIYYEFIVFILILVLIIAGTVIVIIISSLFTYKKRDIAIMKSLGTLREKLYSFYMKEALIIYLIGFLIGSIIGLLSYGLTSLVITFLNFSVNIYIDFFWTPIFFFLTLFAVYIISGYVLRKITQQKIQWIFSKDIPHDFDAKKTLTLIPRWLSQFGFNLKIAITNIIRRKGEFKRFLILFGALMTLVFTLAIGVFVLTSSAENWIAKSQGNNIIVIGHRDVVYNYSLMYQKFSDIDIDTNESTINFTKSNYLFNSSIISAFESIEGIQKIDERLIAFSTIKEINSSIIIEGQYISVGEDRHATIPLIGLDSNEMSQDYEIEGEFFTDEDGYDNITIGDSLARYTFSFPLYQKLRVGNGTSYHIKGILIDSFNNGFTAYFNLETLNEEMGLPTDNINIILIQANSTEIDALENQLETIIKNELGQEFIALNMNDAFNQNLFMLKTLNIIPIILIILFSAILCLSLYNYQKVSLHEKIKDFIIMKAIGAKSKLLKRILFIENFFIIIISSAYSIGVSMIINIIFLFERVTLPPIYEPLLIFIGYLSIFLILNFLSLIPLSKKIKQFSIKDFEVY